MKWLSVMEFGLCVDKSAAGVISELVSFAKQLDELGIGRLLLAEHHQRGRAWAAPEVLLPVLALLTKKLKIGTAGIVLDDVNIRRLTESFRFLETVFPGRIELGLCRGLQVDPGLNGPFSIPCGFEGGNDFGTRIAHLLDLLCDAIPDLTIVPEGAGSPEITILGTSERSAGLAAESGLKYGYSLFRGPSPRYIKLYKDRFQSVRMLKDPRATIALRCLCHLDGKRSLSESLQGVPEVSGDSWSCCRQILSYKEEYCSDEVILVFPVADAGMKKEMITAIVERIDEVVCSNLKYVDNIDRYSVR